MDYKELQANLSILEAHAQELYELVLMLDGFPVMRGQTIEALLDCNDKITGLKKQLSM